MLPLPKRLKMSRWNLQPWTWAGRWVWCENQLMGLVWIYPFQLSRNIIHICQHICSDIRCSHRVELFGNPQIAWWLTTGSKIGGIDLFIKLQNMAIKRNELKHKCRVVVFRYNHKIAVVVVHHWMPRNVDVKLLTTEPSSCGRHRLSGPASKPAKRLGFCQDSPKNHDFYHKLSQVMSTHFPSVSTWPC